MPKQDGKIKQLLTKIEADKKKLGTKPRLSWNTNCMFRYDDSNRLNLNTVKDTGVLVDALAFLLGKQTARDEAAKRLGVKLQGFEWFGYSLKNWEDDFKLKAQTIEWNLQQKKLVALQKQLKELRSEEAKTDEALSDIEKMLG